MKTEQREYQEYLQGKFLPGRQQYLEWLVYPRYLRELPHAAEIWDLGFGNNEFLSFCKKSGIAARGIDSNPYFVTAAQTQRLNAQVDDITLLQSVPDVSVQAAISDNVLEHLREREIEQAFHALERKMVPGGVFLAIIPGEKGFTRDPTHRTFIDEKLINELSANSRLRMEKMFRWPVNAHWVSRVFYLNMTVFKFRAR